MSEEWLYVWIAFGLTWTVLAGYTAWLRARRTAALSELRNRKGDRA